MTAKPHSAHSLPLARCVLAFSLACAGASVANATTAPRTPQSIECSKQADAKGLHGKPREAFRAECKRQAKAAPAPPQTAPAKATN